MPEYVPASRALWQDRRQRRFASAFQTPASGQPVDQVVIDLIDFIFSKSSFDLDITTSNDFVLAPETDDTGRLIIGTNAPLACDILIWNGDTQNILVDRGNHLIQINGVNFNTNVNISANNVFATTAVNGATATFSGAGTFNNLIVGNTGLKVGTATDYFNLGVGANGKTTITTVDSDGALGHVNFAADGNITFGDGGATNYVQIASVGDVLFKGGAGLAYGSMYTNADIARTMTNQNTWYEIDAATAWITGKCHNCTFADPKITVTNAGTYLIQWTISGYVGTASQQIGIGIMIDSTATDGPAHGLPGVQSEGRNQVLFINANRPLSISGQAILQLAAGRTISLATRNVTSAGKTLHTQRGNLTVTQIAGGSA